MKITCGMLAFNDEDIIDMSLNNALSFADEIVILDGGSTDLTVSIIKQIQEKNPDKIKLFIGPEEKPEIYEKQLKDKYGRVLQNGHFGAMKKFIYKKSTGDWIFWLDADECLSDNAKHVLNELANQEMIEAYDIEYIHFIHDFNHIDNSQAVHIGILRFHKNIPGLEWVRYNHAFPEGNFKNRGACFKSMYIFHLGYAKNLLDIWKRYKRNILFSEMHSGTHQCFWRDWHYLNYPKIKSPFNKNQLPKALIERFEIGVYDSEVVQK